MIDITDQQKQIISTTLSHHLPGISCMAFGSRTAGTAKSYSDLDILIMNETPLDIVTLGDLQHAFAESDLPFRIELVQWATTGDSFKEQIKTQLVKLV